MSFQTATNLAEASQLAPRNTFFAHNDVGENLKAIVEDFRDQFFGLLDPGIPAQNIIYRWSVPIQYGIDLTLDGITGSRPEDAWRLGLSISGVCKEADSAQGSGAISAALAAALLAAYNSAFS